jgi:hypothetical protein
VERGITRELGGTADIHFDPAGVRALIRIPLQASAAPE